MEFGNCRLCLGAHRLCRSHIIPRWAFKRALHGDVHTTTNLVHIRDGIASYSDAQMTEPLLCEVCEARLKVWEDYVCKISRQRSGAFPALRGLTTLLGIPSSSGELRGRQAPELKTDHVASFGASVLWRASVSTVFPDVSLGRYEEQFRQYLLGNTPFVPNAGIVVQLIEAPTAPIDETIFGPQELAADDPYHKVYRFALWGMLYFIAVGEVVPNSWLELCVACWGRVLVGPCTPMVNAALMSFATAEPKGKLAREGSRPTIGSS